VFLVRYRPNVYVVSMKFVELCAVSGLSFVKLKCSGMA
jgi:hypothetical protein